ncbi:hypothetical protein OAN61_00165 [bacterium]|nr:hypothetical protein [bacterium]
MNRTLGTAILIARCVFAVIEDSVSSVTLTGGAFGASVFLALGMFGTAKEGAAIRQSMTTAALIRKSEEEGMACCASRKYRHGALHCLRLVWRNAGRAVTGSQRRLGPAAACAPVRDLHDIFGF